MGVGDTGRANGSFAGGFAKDSGGDFNLPRRTPSAEAYRRHEPRLYPSQLINPTLALGANYGQNGDNDFPIQYKYARYIAGVGKMFDTRDFVNHCLDSRSSDYMPRGVPDPSTIGGMKGAMGFPPVHPNGTKNAYNPPELVHGLPPLQKSDYHCLQYY